MAGANLDKELSKLRGILKMSFKAGDISIGMTEEFYIRLEAIRIEYDREFRSEEECINKARNLVSSLYAA